MFKLKRGYFYAVILLIISIGCIISSCGGGSNNGTLPVTNTNSTIDSNPSAVTSTPTPALTNINLSGYIYGNNITTDEGETVPNITVLDVPASKADSSGNEPFITQVLNSLKSDYPQDWARPEVQELYAQLDKTLSESKPLPEYNAQAQVSSVYSDTTIPVGSDGHFDNTVLTGATDSTVKLGVTLGEDSYTEVETLPSSANITNINSSDATGAVLKSCPEKICAFPGEILIFKVYSEPGINLKSAGLKFTLNNTSIGCITQPVYLCLFGAHKYQVAYGCVYIKPGLDTPVDTTITAKLNSGQSINIFLEVIKKAASISGTVYTGGMPLVKGFVYSIGPKAYCKLDANGVYILPKVFRGHERSVVAVWQTSENGQKIWHREAKKIDFFNVDLTGFNFGVPPTPTPTVTPIATRRPPYDRFYDDRVSEVINQYDQWREQIGYEQAVLMTVNWLKGNLSSGPTVPAEISGANLGKSSPGEIWIYFADGHGVSLELSSGIHDTITIEKGLQNNDLSSNKLSSTPIVSSNELTGFPIVNSNVLILAPYVYEAQSISSYNRPEQNVLPRGTRQFSNCVFSDLEQEFRNEGYTVDSVITTDLDISPDLNMIRNEYNNGVKYMVVPFNINPGQENNIVRPDDFKNLSNYGVIYIYTHGNGLSTNDLNSYGTSDIWDGTLCCNYCENDTELKRWINDRLSRFDYYLFMPDPNNPDLCDLNNPRTWGTWTFSYKADDYQNTITSQGSSISLYSKHIRFVRRFFEQNQLDNPIHNSILYLSACYGWDLKDIFAGNGNVYLSYNKGSFQEWSGLTAYYYFYYLMHGFKKPSLIPGYIDGPYLEPPSGPMNVKQAYDILSQKGFKVNPDPYRYPFISPTEPQHFQDCELKIDTQNGLNDNTRLPVSLPGNVCK